MRGYGPFYTSEYRQISPYHPYANDHARNHNGRQSHIVSPNVLNRGYSQLPEISDQSLQGLLRPRARPGNPRPRQTVVNKYAKFDSNDAPQFDGSDEFTWAYFGKDPSDQRYKGIFKNRANKSTVAEIKNRLNITDINISPLQLKQRAAEASRIRLFEEVAEFKPENNPISSTGQQDKDKAREVIDECCMRGDTPEEFRLKHPELASIKSNRIWYKNAYDATIKDKQKIENQEAVVWLESKLNNMQNQLIGIIEQEHIQYNRRYDTDSKKILMGNRNILVVVSPHGGTGLTTVFKFLKMKYGEQKVMCLSSGGKPSDTICNYHCQLETTSQLQYLFWNIPREGFKNFRWETVEQICDALTTSNKYVAQTKTQAPPVIVIGTNHMFELQTKQTKKQAITLDRIKLYRVRRAGALQAIDVFEYYLQKYGEDLRLNQEDNDDSDFDLCDL